MENETCNLKNDSVRLNADDIEKNIDESSLDFVDTVCESLQYKNEFATADEHLNETKPENFESKEEVFPVIVGSPKSLILGEVRNNSFSFGRCDLQTDNDIFKVGPCSEDVADDLFLPTVKPEQQSKDSTHVVHVQVAPGATSERAADEDSAVPPQTNFTKVHLEDPRLKSKLKTEPLQTPDSQEMDGFQFLTPEVTTRKGTPSSSSLPREPIISKVQGAVIHPIPSSTSHKLNIINTRSVTPVKNNKVFPVQQQSNKSSTWIVSSSSSSGNSGCSTEGIGDSPLLYQANETPASYSHIQNPMTATGNLQHPEVQRYITTDDQIVYGWKDSNGEFHLLCSSTNDRETHNEKERRRRSRVSEACSAMRALIPGLTDKTDKATVFEQAARYLCFLREKFGTDFDQAYCEKYYKGKV